MTNDRYTRAYDKRTQRPLLSGWCLPFQRDSRTLLGGLDSGIRDRQPGTQEVGIHDETRAVQTERSFARSERSATNACVTPARHKNHSSKRGLPESPRCDRECSILGATMDPAWVSRSYGYGGIKCVFREFQGTAFAHPIRYDGPCCGSNCACATTEGSHMRTS